MSEKITVVEIDTQPAQTSLRDLRNQLKAVKDQMAGLDEGSDAFLEAANKAGELKHQLDEIQQAVSGASSDFGDLMGNVAKVGAGITGAFQTANAALSMFGIESEEVTKSIKAMQNMMAMTQGLTSIDAAIKSINKLRNSITATTTAAKILKVALQPKVFIAITAAVMALVAAFKYLRKGQEEAAEKQRLFNEQLKEAETKKLQEYTTAVDDLRKANERLRDSLDTRTTTEKWADEIVESTQNVTKAQGEIAKIQKDIDRYRGNLRTIWANLSADKKKEKEEQLDLFISQKQALEDEIELEKERQDLLQKNIDKKNAEEAAEEKKKRQEEARRKAASKKEVDEIAEAIKLEYARLELRKEQDRQYGESKAALEDYLTIQNKELAHLKELGKEGTVEYVKMETAIAKTANEILDFGKDTEEATEELTELEKAIAAIELIESSLDLAFAKGSMTEKEYTSAILIQEEAKLALLQEGTEEWYKQAIAVENYRNKLDSIDTERISEGISRIGEVGSMAFSALEQSLNAFADLQDETTREGFEKQKKLQIAATTMNMLSGVMSAWTSAMNPANAWMTIWGQIAVGAAQTIATVAMGAAQIKKIQQTTFDGGGSSGSVASMSSAGSTVIAPVQYTQDVNGANIEGAIKDSKVYVTETDISNTQRRVSVAETENRY